MIGGAAVTLHYADEVGADGYAPDTASAVHLARGLTAG
jgi:methanogenic corrinoid protein MtbC1